MSRRSSRLASGGYYHSDEESDSSSITTISYRENTVKVFKKNRGPRRKRAEPGVGLVSPSESTEDQPEGWKAVSRPALRSPLSAASVPALPSAPIPPSRPSSLAPSVLRVPSVPRVLHFSDSPHSAVDSSGYSSSEGPCRRLSSKAGAPSRAGPGADYRQRLGGAVSRLTAAVTAAAAVVQSRVRHARSGALSAHVSGVWMKTVRVLLFLLFILMMMMAVWFLWPCWTSLLSAGSFMKGPSRIVDPQTPLPNTALDSAVVTAAVEAKMRHVLEEMQLKYELLVSEVQQVQVDLQTFRQTGLSEIGLRVEEQWAQRQSSATGLSVRLSAVEEQLSRLVQTAKAPPDPALLSPDLQQVLDSWLSQRLQEFTAADRGRCEGCGRPLADKMADFALESQGASVVSTRCSETYRTRSACVSVFGLPLWYPSESPRTVIQGPPVLLPGKCWAFRGVQGTLLIALSHPVRISHVTLDHLPRSNSPTGRIDSAPKDFQVYGLKNETEEGRLLGEFRYREDGESTQTFSLTSLTDEMFLLAELRVLSNWGHVQYTCVYRFRVHGQMVQT